MSEIQGKWKGDHRKGKKARLRLSASRKKRRIPTALLLWRQKSQLGHLLAKQHEFGEPSTSSSTPPPIVEPVVQQKKPRQKSILPASSTTDTTNKVQLEIPELLEVNIKEEPVEVCRDGSSFEMVTVPGCSPWHLPEPTALPPEHESEIEQIPLNPEKICRLCMSTEGLTGLYDTETVLQELPTKIVDVTAVEVCKDDGLPQFICHTCISTVQNFFDFKMQCSVTNVTLKAEQRKNSTLPSKPKKSDLTEFQKLNKRLKSTLQSFYDLVDAINLLQDKARRQLEIGFPGIQGTIVGQKRKTVPFPSEIGLKHIKSANQMPLIETGSSLTLLSQIQSPRIVTAELFDMDPINNISNDLPVTVKSELESDPELEPEFVTSDFVHTKLEIEENSHYNSTVIADHNETLPSTIRTANFQKSNESVLDSQELTDRRNIRNSNDSLSISNVT